MDDESLLAQLESVCRALGIKVRYEPCEEAPGGLCELRGERLVIVDDALPAARRAAVLAAALAELDTEGLYMPPAVRDLIERQRPDRP